MRLTKSTSTDNTSKALATWAGTLNVRWISTGGNDESRPLKSESSPVAYSDALGGSNETGSPLHASQHQGTRTNHGNPGRSVARVCGPSWFSYHRVPGRRNQRFKGFQARAR